MLNLEINLAILIRNQILWILQMIRFLQMILQHNTEKIHFKDRDCYTKILKIVFLFKIIQNIVLYNIKFFLLLIKYFFIILFFILFFFV